MEQIARVISVEENRAEILIVRDSACGDDCGECRLCEEKEKKDWVINDINAKIGDTVKVTLKSSSFLSMATFAYLVPVILAALLSYFYRTVLPVRYADLCSAVTLFVLVAAIAISGRKLFSGEKYQSRITEIVEQDNERLRRTE